MSSPCFEAVPAKARNELIAAIGERGVLDRPEDLALYEYDGSVDKARPDLVVFPRTTQEVSAIVKIAAAHQAAAKRGFRAVNLSKRGTAFRVPFPFIWQANARLPSRS